MVQTMSISSGVMGSVLKAQTIINSPTVLLNLSPILHIVVGQSRTSKHRSPLITLVSGFLLCPKKWNGLPGRASIQGPRVPVRHLKPRHNGLSLADKYLRESVEGIWMRFGEDWGGLNR